MTPVRLPVVVSIHQCMGYTLSEREQKALEDHSTTIITEADRDDEPTVYYVLDNAIVDEGEIL